MMCFFCKNKIKSYNTLLADNWRTPTSHHLYTTAIVLYNQYNTMYSIQCTYTSHSRTHQNTYETELHV